MSDDRNQHLLSNPHGDFSTPVKQDEHEIQKSAEDEENETPRQILKNVLTSVAQLSFSLTFNFITTNVYLILLSNQLPDVQGAVSLGISLMNIFGNAVIVSMNFGLTNRLSHVYGAKNYKLMGLYLHRGMLLSFLAVIICSLIVYFSPTLFSHFGYSAGLVSNMQKFVEIAMFQFIFQAIFQVYSAYLSALSLFDVLGIIMILASLICTGLAVVMIKVWNMQLEGVALALIIQNLISSLFSVCYVHIKNPVKESIFCFTRDSFRGIWELAKYLSAAGGQMFIDWIGYDIMILLSGTLIVQQCDAFILSLNLYFLVSATIVACNITASSLVGNAMGAKKVATAKKYAKTTLIVNLTYILMMVCVIEILTGYIVDWYSDDEEVQNYMDTILRLMMIIFPFDGLNFVLGAVVRSIKHESKAVIITFVNMYLIAIPTAFVLVLVGGLQVYGILIAFFLVTSLSASCFAYLSLKTDWNHQADLIAKAIEEDHKKIEEYSPKKVGVEVDPIVRD